VNNGILIGIDAGTTIFKAVAFEAKDGSVIAEAHKQLPILSPRPGYQVTPVKALDNALNLTMRQLRIKLGRRWKDLTGIGIAAQGGSTMVVDRHTGESHTDMILWCDARGSDEAIALRARKPDRWWRKTMRNNWTPAGLGRLAWLLHSDKKLRARSSDIFVGAGEYLYHALTGVWRQDAGSALQMGTYNPDTGNGDTGPVQTLLPELRGRFAPIRHRHDTNTLSEGGAKRIKLDSSTAPIPVAGPYMDQEAGLASVSSISEKPLQVSLGTAWVGNFNEKNTRKGFAGLQFVINGSSKDNRTVILPLLTGNAAWNWALKAFVDERHERALLKSQAIFSESLLPPIGMVCVPWFLQPNPLEHDAHGAGTFYGVDPSSTPADFLRAVACGMCFELFRVFKVLKESKSIDAVIISGGAAKAPQFRTLIATLFSPVPVYIQKNEDTAAARGALTAFNASMSKSPVSRIPVAKGKLAVDIVLAFQSYEKIYGALYKNCPLGAAYTVEKDQ